MKAIEIVGFLPDADPTTPGILTDCTNLVPSSRGMKGAPSLAPAGIAALSAACQGSALLFKLDASYRLFAGTATKLYEASSGTWSDVSVGAGTYTSTTNRWRFCQLGNTTFATNKVDSIQQSSSGAFANVTGPKASIIFTVSGQVMALATNDGTYGDLSDGWWASKYQDGTNWTLSVADKCVRGRLVDTPGGFTAGRALGYYAVAYKDRGIYIGQPVDSDAVWQWSLVPGTEVIGAPCQEAVVNIGGAHIFPGWSDFYLFNGSSAQSIGNGISEWFFNRLNPRYRANIIGAHDYLRGQVFFFYPSSDSSTGAIDSGVVYSYRYNKWGRFDVAVEAAVESLVQSITYATLDDFFATYADLNITYDSPFWKDSQPVVAVFNSSHTPKTITGASESSSMTTWVIGDDEEFSALQHVRPRFSKAPTSATMTNYYANNSGVSMTTDQTISMSDGKFDATRSARWHKFEFDFTGEHEVTHIAATGTGAGFK